MGSGIPAVRFKDELGIEFPDWEKKPLREIASPVKQKNQDMSVKNVLTNSATRGIINQRDYFDKDVANSKNLGGYYVVHMDDFVYNPRISEQAPVGPIKRNHLHTGVMSPLYTVFRVKEGHRTFSEFYFQTKIWHRYMNSVANFGARHDRMAIALVDFYSLPMPIPSYKERNKVVDFLTAVDRRIQQLIQKKALLEDYKKGVMQQLFSQTIRFKDDNGNDFPDWEEKMLGQLGSFIGGGTPNTGQESFWQGDIPWISSSDISESSITEIKKHRFITEAAIDASATKLVAKNSILFISRVGVGKLAICMEQVCTSQDFTNFTPLKDDIKYLGYYFSFNQNLLKRYAQGTSIKGITSKELKKIAVARPSIPEQTKIANFISAIDRKIETVATQITETQTFKRGLLQQMFV